MKDITSLQSDFHFYLLSISKLHKYLSHESPFSIIVRLAWVLNKKTLFNIPLLELLELLEVLEFYEIKLMNRY